MKLSEISANLAAVDAQLKKAQAEILNRISELQAALADVEVPVEATEALDRLAASAKALDDIVPDA
jgi:precorrin-6B methylase 1